VVDCILLKKTTYFVVGFCPCTGENACAGAGESIGKVVRG
jgi:hypothetical protein